MSNIKYIIGIFIVIWFFSFIFTQYKKAKKEEISYNKKTKNESKEK